ncbi:MAG: double-strand break repair protein AddB [Pseudomonadota bacterium]
MFDDQRLFGLAPGVDFPAALVAGLEERLQGTAPEAWARVTLIVNTRRMARRLRDIFDSGPPRLLPRIVLVTDVSSLCRVPPKPAHRSTLRRRLDLMGLVQRLIDQDSGFSLHGSLFDLTDSLAALFDEMEAEGVAPEDVSALDVSDQSGHWARTQAFVGIARQYLDQLGLERDKGAQAKAEIDALVAEWQDAPPLDPVIVAGSTGSRAAALTLMKSVIALPQGAVVLPGFDFDLPSHGWNAMTSEDHPQFRFRALAHKLRGAQPVVAPWADAPPPSAPRNALVSLALRPAPTTDAWLKEGPSLGSLHPALENVTLVTAESERDEAQAIALRLRQAAEDRQTAALISPDRMLTRRVAAALDQWGLIPDDSAGTPLHLSPPGRFVRHVARLFSQPLDAEALLTLLKHPLTASSEARGAHTALTQALELKIRRKGMPYPDRSALIKLAEDPDWAAWAADCLCDHHAKDARSLGDWATLHRDITERLANGLGQKTSALWLQLAGIGVRQVMDDLLSEAENGPLISARDFAGLVDGLLEGAEPLRDRDKPHPDIMIWGTMEARVQGANLVILGGLNDGIWPAVPAPDPWLNRQMRRDAGLLLPERNIGLSAHDFQQAIAAPEVWLTRSLRADGAETVPSRWLNRLSNLAIGLPEQHGGQALDAALTRGNAWLAAVSAREAVTPVAPAPRPSPRPPVAARPRKLRVTEVQTLKRDPYAIYARHCLGLKPLGPLVQTPDALLRGTVLHTVMERFVKQSLATGALTEDMLRQIGQAVLADEVPWPAARALWQARLDRIARPFVTHEDTRQATATPTFFEEDAAGTLKLPEIGMELSGKADRIDIAADGGVYLYDYKSGSPPSKKQLEHYDKQLLIEALMVEEGSFDNLGPAPAVAAVYLGLGQDLEQRAADLGKEPPAVIKADLIALLGAYLDRAQGYTARNEAYREDMPGDYDQLARYGEWDSSADATAEDVG